MPIKVPITGLKQRSDKISSPFKALARQWEAMGDVGKMPSAAVRTGNDTTSG